MKIFYVIIISFISLCGFSQGSNLDGRNLSSDFESFAEEESEPSGYIRSPYFASVLPDDFFSKPKENWIIGISDPTKDTIIAYEQALYRAKCIAALQVGCVVKSKSDFFSSEVKGGGIAQKHIMLALVKNDCQFNCPALKVQEVLHTDFNETIILATIEENPGEKLSFIAEMFITETTRHNQGWLSERINSYSSDKTKEHSDSMLYYLEGNKFDLYSEFNGTKSGKKKISHKYSQETPGEQTDLEMLSAGYSKAPLTHGLWAGYLHVVLRQLQKLSDNSYESRKMGDVQNGRISNLGDERLNSKFSYKPEDLTVINNNIYLKCSILELH